MILSLAVDLRGMGRLKTPPILYKYLGPKGVVVLESSTIKFTPPLELNDPFESRLPLMTRFLDHAADGGRIVFPGDQQLFVNKVNETYGITCFSTVPDSLLMWAHYASAHSGIVIGFSTAHKAFADLGDLAAVKYSSRRPILPMTMGDQSRRQMLTTKSGDWAYEKEWRITTPLSGCTKRDGNYFKSIDPECIVTVILGARVDDTLKLQVTRWWSAHRCARVLQARLHSLDFGLYLDQNLEFEPSVIAGPQQHVPVGADLPFCSRLEMQDGVLTVRDVTAEVIPDAELRSSVQAGIKTNAQVRIVIYPSKKLSGPTAVKKSRRRRIPRSGSTQN